MSSSSRVSAVEDSLDPLAIVLKVIADCQAYGSLDACARAIAEAPVEAAPLSRIGDEIEASVRASMKGRSRDDVNDAVRLAVGDGVFRFILFLRLNTSALEIADRDGMAACALTSWLGFMLNLLPEDGAVANEPPEHDEAKASPFELWRSMVAILLVKVMAEDEARERLEARYLGGRSALFADADGEGTALPSRSTACGRSRSG
jgi:hypothetical protein